MDAECTFVGLSVGPFRLVVAGPQDRAAIPSAVGWPKDAIAREQVGAPAIFGEGLLLHRPSLNIIRPFDRWANPASMDTVEKRYAATQLLQHAVSLARPRADRPVFGVVAVPVSLDPADRQALIQACRDALDATVLVAEPRVIAIATGRADLALVVDIGADRTDLHLVQGDDVQPMPYLDLGTDVIDTAMRSAARAHSSELPINAIVRAAYDRDDMAMVPTANLNAIIAAGVDRMAGPLAMAVTRALSTLPANRRDLVASNVVLAGSGARLTGLSAALMSRLGSSVICVTDAMFAPAEGARLLASAMGIDAWRLLLRPLAGTQNQGTMHPGHSAIPMPKAASILRRMTG